MEPMGPMDLTRARTRGAPSTEACSTPLSGALQGVRRRSAAPPALGSGMAAFAPLADAGASRGTKTRGRPTDHRQGPPRDGCN